jgi:hypothetical protein
VYEGSTLTLSSRPLSCERRLHLRRPSEACADAQARADSESGHAHGAFGACPDMAQNECPGWGALTGPAGIVPGCLEAMWAEGPGGGHYDNMTRAGYTLVSCGFYVTPGGAVWSVQDFR